MRVLIVEDNKALAGNIGDFLSLKNAVVDYAENGKQCIELAKSSEYDVIILDVMMPGMDGFQTCEVLRNELQNTTPVLFLTAKSELQDKVTGFELGADDYLTKPFELDELYCRLMALNARGERKDLGTLRYSEIELSLKSKQASRNGSSLKLNQTQFDILRVLVSKAPNIVSRNELEYEIWGDEPPDSDVLRTQIYRLRSTLDKPFPFAYLETVHGQGFRLVEPGSENND